MDGDGSRGRGSDGWVLAGLLAYTVVVHGVDTLAAVSRRGRPIFGVDWRVFRWTTESGFDGFKFAAWFLVPLVVLALLGRIEPGWFGLRRLRRIDWAVTAALAGCGVLGVLAISVVPDLQAWYPGVGDWPAAAKQAFLAHQLAWTFSWIVGWEFLHRYALLTQLMRVWPRWGWLVVPAVEGLYHLQKAPIEMAGMVGLSLVVTRWAMARRNLVPAALVHLLIEVELIVFLLVTT